MIPFVYPWVESLSLSLSEILEEPGLCSRRPLMGGEVFD